EMRPHHRPRACTESVQQEGTALGRPRRCYCHEDIPRLQDRTRPGRHAARQSLQARRRRQVRLQLGARVEEQRTRVQPPPSPEAEDAHSGRPPQELIRLKKGELSWLYEVSKCAPQEALRALDGAFS